MSSKGPTMMQKCTMEFFSCFLIVLTIQNAGYHSYAAFAVAVSFFIGVFVAANVSGAHLNPAVTFMIYLNEKERNPHATKITKYLPYIAAQILGATFGALLSDVLGGFTQTVGFTISHFNGFFAEALFTFFLCAGVSVIADPHSGMDPAMCGLVVCTIIFITAISLGSATKGIVNPAIGIALVTASSVKYVSREFDPVLLLIYITAPLVGAYAAHHLYVKIIQPAMQQDHINDE